MIQKRASDVSDAPIQRISTESAYRSVIKALGRQLDSPRVLRHLMGVVENYRAKRKLGWSRPWNKYGLTTFQAFKLDPSADADLFARAKSLLDAIDDVPDDAREFVAELIADSDQLMGFVFLSEYEEDGAHYETATLSLGRHSTSSARHRDRFDIVLDAPVVELTVKPVARMRLYIDPYTPARKEPLYSATVGDPLPEQAVALFAMLARLSSEWAEDETKLWDHWTSKYVDYFGERQHEQEGSHFKPRQAQAGQR